MSFPYPYLFAVRLHPQCRRTLRGPITFRRAEAAPTLRRAVNYTGGPPSAGMGVAPCMCMRIHTGAGSHLVGGFV